MNSSHTSTALDAHTLNRLHDRAQADAKALRGTAIDQFWRVSFSVLRASLAAALRLPAPQARRAGPGSQKTAAPASPCCGAA